MDGSTGEGGGQILRTALALSCLKQVPARIFNIRKNRKKPGLQPQHLCGVLAAAAISGAKVLGAAIGSEEISFSPGPVRPGNYVFDIGTAGSTSLLFQTILPALAFSSGPSTVKITGGTHNPLAPSFEYVKDVFLPMLGRLGLKAGANIERYGFYPVGGGSVSFSIKGRRQGGPLNDIAKDIDLRARGRLLSISGISAVANLPLSIAGRQRASAAIRLKGFSPQIEVREVPSYGTGTFVFLLARYEGALCGFGCLGERGKKAETVGEEAAEKFLSHHCEGAPSALDPHMADQIVLYLAKSGAGKKSFTTSRITEHLLTNLWVIGRFLKFECGITGGKEGPGLVELAV